MTTLARRLLRAASGRSLVLRTLLSGTVIWAVGCIVPVNLEKESAVPNTRPSIVGGEPDFTMRTVLRHDDSLTLKVIAQDPDVHDTLTARLYRQNEDPQESLWITTSQNLTTTSDDGVERSLTISDPWCKAWGAMKSMEYLLTVYVSDNDFPINGDPPAPEHSDSKTWVILCN